MATLTNTARNRRSTTSTTAPNYAVNPITGQLERSGTTTTSDVDESLYPSLYGQQNVSLPAYEQQALDALRNRYSTSAGDTAYERAQRQSRKDSRISQQARQEAEAKARESEIESRAYTERSTADARAYSEKQAQQAQMYQLETLAKQSAQAEAQLRLRQQIEGESEARRLGRVPEIMKQLPQLGDNASYFSPGDYAAEDAAEKAATEAAFSRAREQAGSASFGAMKGLLEAMAGRGLSGSSIEANMAGSVLGDARGTVGDVGRELAIQRGQSAGRRADRNIGAGLTRRGQDISKQQSQMQALLNLLY